MGICIYTQTYKLFADTAVKSYAHDSIITIFLFILDKIERYKDYEAFPCFSVSHSIHCCPLYTDPPII